MGATLLERVGGGLANYLEQPSRRYVTFSVTPIDRLRDSLRPGDVLLVEGDKRVSVAIKYLTQSTWSHAAFYVGDDWGGAADGSSEPRSLIEADLQLGVIAVPLAKYESLNTRICRPVGLSNPDRRKVVRFMIERLGMRYDLKNVIDLMRYPAADAAGSGALAPAHAGAGQRRPYSGDLLDPDRPGVPIGPLSDPAACARRGDL